jgi:hypothetical protein
MSLRVSYAKATVVGLREVDASVPDNASPGNH